MGKVYLAVDNDRRNVAIKVLPPRKALEEANVLKRFRREMELSQRCVHPNLARTIAVGNDGDVYYMVMEYIPGKSLYDLVKSDGAGPLRVPDAARLFLKVVDGLEGAHKAGPVPNSFATPRRPIFAAISTVSAAPSTSRWPAEPRLTGGT
jgi:serine/threonine-protein kinase